MWKGRHVVVCVVIKQQVKYVVAVFCGAETLVYKSEGMAFVFSPNQERQVHVVAAAPNALQLYGIGENRRVMKRRRISGDGRCGTGDSDTAGLAYEDHNIAVGGVGHEAVNGIDNTEIFAFVGE